MRRSAISQGWEFRSAAPGPGYHRPQLVPQDWMAAEVPGNVHLDLVRNGIIADPFRRRFEIGAQWVDETDWTYRCSFDWQPGSERTRVLRFEGLDTLATVFLNEVELGRHDNMHLPVEFDVTEILNDGANELVVELRSAVLGGMERRRTWFEKHGLPQDFVYFDERAFVRKPGYMSGWDWGPRLVGCGIWGNVELLEFDERLGDLELQVFPMDGSRFRVVAESNGELSLVLNPETRIVESSKQGRRSEWILEGGQWWPRGMGHPVLHAITARLGNQVVTKHFGLRRIELVRRADEFGESFEFHVNGLPLWARGANWIPNDSFPSRIAGTVAPEIRRYAEMGFNMLRVWGGGFYESEEFYEACDESGILVWQDFSYGCMYYPDDVDCQISARAEALHHVRRLRHRACLALWCGNNENLTMFQTKWGGSPGRQVDRYYGEHIYDCVLPELLAKEDPTRPYIASSPIGMSPDETTPGRNANMGGFGDSHYWDVWHGRGDWKYYRDSTARFSSEFGFASSCSLAQWNECLEPEDLHEFPNSVIHHHNKTGKSWETFLGFVTLHYPDPESLEDWVYYSQLNQRDALRYGIEHYRRSDFCRGTLIWQANDCWPVQSWAVQDYSRLLKPAAYELTRLYSDLMVSVDYLPGEPKLDAYVCNDGIDSERGRLQVVALDTKTGRETAEWGAAFDLPPNSRRKVLEVDVEALPPTSTALRLSIGNPLWDRWVFLDEPKNSLFGAANLACRHEGDRLEITVDGFVGDLVVWDETNPQNIVSARVGYPGWDARTLCNEVVEYRMQASPGSLRARSLAGFHDLRTQASDGREVSHR